MRGSLIRPGTDSLNVVGLIMIRKDRWEPMNVWVAQRVLKRGGDVKCNRLEVIGNWHIIWMLSIKSKIESRPSRLPYKNHSWQKNKSRVPISLWRISDVLVFQETFALIAFLVIFYFFVRARCYNSFEILVQAWRLTRWFAFALNGYPNQAGEVYLRAWDFAERPSETL